MQERPGFSLLSPNLKVITAVDPIHFRVLFTSQEFAVRTKDANIFANPSTSSSGAASVDSDISASAVLARECEENDGMDAGWNDATAAKRDVLSRCVIVSRLSTKMLFVCEIYHRNGIRFHDIQGSTESKLCGASA